jgi:hypothetical protein
MNNCCICWFFTHIFTARRLYNSFDVQGLNIPGRAALLPKLTHFFKFRDEICSLRCVDYLLWKW